MIIEQICLRRPWQTALVAVACLADVPAVAAGDHLTFEDRVQAQAVIQRVYQSHQVDDARPFEEAMPRAVLEAQVASYLRKSAALEKYWKTPITREMLLAEVARMRRGSRMPERLAEIERALGDDPLLIEECLARPVLVDRLVRNFFALDQSMHAAARSEIERLRERLVRGDVSPVDPDPHRSLLEIEAASAAADATVRHVAGGIDRLDVDPAEFARWRARLPLEAGETGDVEEERDRFVFRVLLDASPERLRFATYEVSKRPFDAWWREAERSLDPASVDSVGSRSDVPPSPRASAGACVPGTWDNGILDDVPEPRTSHTAVWTGSVLVVWGGARLSGRNFDSGGRYDPATDFWQPTSTTGAPAPRSHHVAVWTGSSMVVWGGVGNGATPSSVGTLLNTGARYDPVSDAWEPIAMTGAPTARAGATAVWSGIEMIVWGGFVGSGGVYVNTGGRYNPDTDSWTPVATLAAPEARGAHGAIFIAGKMMVWGGQGTADPRLDSGGLYDPAADAWTPTSMAGAPAARYGNALVAIGGRAVVWGGNTSASQFSTTGGRYDPATDTWDTTSTTGMAPRYGFTAVAAGAEMILWSGFDPNGQFLRDGGRYDPALDTWIPVTSLNAPPGRRGGSAIWTGSRMVVWGGTGRPDTSRGGRYDPATDTWTPTATLNAPEARLGYGAAWTGNDLIVWGGRTQDDRRLDTGGRYNLALDAWQPISLVAAPTPREAPTAVWSGSRMIVWGGANTTQGSFYATGGRYDPLTDAWTATATAGAPAARYRHTAVWTGREMIVWGGTNLGSVFNSGGRYDPATDSWTSTALSGPVARSDHKAVWTGREMIVWGGGGLSSGGRYNPLTNSWAPTSISGAPTDNSAAVATWSGSEMLVWGSDLAGYRYDPAGDFWSGASSPGEPTTYAGHSAVWTGHAMMVWGGTDAGSGFALNVGSGYDPLADSWTPITTIGAPPPSSGHSAFWTGNRMLVIWGGGGLMSGGAYCACAGPVIVYYQDADDDGFGDAGMPLSTCDQPVGYVTSSGDCSDSDAGAWAVPSETQNLVFTDAVTMQWTPPSSPGASSLTYDVIRSDAPNDFATTVPFCVASDTTETAATDFDFPRVFYYLVRAQNACPGGLGPLGTGSDGTPREGLDCP
jgi:N-acetylneuraminic acid mutarotase